MNARVLLEALEQPTAYREALARLRERHGLRAGGLRQAELSLAELPPHTDAELARLLARRVAGGSYEFSVVEERRAHLGGKWRQVYRASLIDTVVLSVLARTVTALFDSDLSPRVYSYRKGRSSRQAIRDLAGAVRAHRAEHPLPQRRGLHVLRRDITSYGDRIPVHDGSPLWPQLEQRLASAGCPPGHYLQPLLRGALRPEVQYLDGRRRRPERGVPMGSPLQPAVCNLYLRPVDAALERLGGYYARFGDDLIFLHEREQVARAASRELQERLPALELELNQRKTQDLFWNGAGRPPEARVSEHERGTTHVDYLGARVSFHGGVALGEHKLRRVRRELRERAHASERLLRELPWLERCRAVSEAVSLALDPRSPVALPLAAALHAESDDRGKLAELDHWLARTLAEALSGQRGARAFRRVPFRELRERGLVSLVQRRVRGAAAR